MTALIIACISLVAAIIALNVWYRRHRAAMSPEERRRHDEEIDEESQVW